jgi:hypothetical protein
MKTIASILGGAVLGAGAIAASPPSQADIERYQTDYFSKNGKYVEVHTYEGPQGSGYQIVEWHDNVETSQGFGPEASERTYSREYEAYLP